MPAGRQPTLPRRVICTVIGVSTLSSASADSRTATCDKRRPTVYLFLRASASKDAEALALRTKKRQGPALRSLGEGGCRGFRG